MTAMATSSTTDVALTPLLALAQQLRLPDQVVELVRSSGCETPADWKYAVLDKPSDIHELSLWNAVRDAPALDVGGMELLAAEAQAKRRPPPPAAAALLKKAKFLAKRTTPFR